MNNICKDRVVIVTGAGRGLGRVYAIAFARQGAKVVVNDLGTSINGEGCDAITAQLVVDEIRREGGIAVANSDDVADWDGSSRLVQTALREFGTLDVLVNNAGFVRDRMFVSQNIEEWDAVIRVHLRGHFCVTSHAVTHWRAAKKADKVIDARIINTSSGAGLHGSMSQSVYSAAKGGIASLTLVQAAELSRYGITVNALAPAARTRMTEEAFAIKMRLPDDGFDQQDPENIAPMVVWLGSSQSAHVSGLVFDLEGGRITIANGWNDGPTIDKGSRWLPEELSSVIDQLVAQRPMQKKVWGS